MMNPDKLFAVVRDVFALDKSVVLTGSTKLREIPGWDSMSSVNFEMGLEQAYGIDPTKVTLKDETTLGDLTTQLG